MTPDIQRLAKEAGPELYNLCLSHRGPLIPDLIKFAALVAEECAKLVDPDAEHRKDASWGYLGGEEGLELLDAVAKAIRAKFALSNETHEAK